MTRITRAQIALGLVAAAALVLAATAAARTQASNASPIVIGWAFDSKGAMAPFDGPALAAAQVRVKQINAKGGVGGRPLQIETCDTQGNKPAIAKACATKLLGQQYLQITYRVLLRVIATGVAIESHAPLRAHADVMRRLMENGVQRCIAGMILRVQGRAADAQALFVWP